MQGPTAWDTHSIQPSGYMPLEPAPPRDPTLREYMAILWQYRATFIAVFMLILASGIVLTVRTPSVYRTGAVLSVPTRSVLTGISDSSPISPFVAAAQSDSIDTQLRILQSSSLVQQATARAGITARPGVPPPSVMANVIEDPDSSNSKKESQLIQLVVEGRDPRTIARLANAMGQLFVKHQSFLTRSGLRDTLEFLRNEQQRAGASLAAIERRAVRLQQFHGGTSPSTEREIRAAEYSNLMARVLEAQNSVASTKAQAASLRSRLDKEPNELIQVVTKENPRIAKLKDKLDDLRFQRADLLREYLPTSRLIRDLDTQIAALDSEVAAEPQELQTRSHLPNPARTSLQSQLAALETALPGQEESYRTAAAQLEVKRQLLKSVGPREAETNRLDRDRETAQSTYTMLTDRLRDLEIRSRAQLPSARIIDAAVVPSAPVRPRKPLQIALAFGLAVILAAGVVFLQNSLNDERVSSLGDMGRDLSLPTLGTVPPVPAHQSRLVHALPANSPIAEAYRSLRVSIGFAAADQPLHRLQITSPSGHEGRSTTVVNLATAMARDGKRVIIVDADLRKPHIHRLLNTKHAPGLTEVLAGTHSLEEAVQPSVVDGLLLLPAGERVLNPAELLGSRAFDGLLEQLDQRADVVVFDSPPCLPVADAAILAGRMDGVILVVQTGTTRKSAIKQAMALLSQTRTRVLGTLLTQMRGVLVGGYYYSPANALRIASFHGTQPTNGHIANGNGPTSQEELDAAVARSRRDAGS